MAENRYQLFRWFKYAIYALLSLNVFLFFSEEWAAARLQYPFGIPVASLIEAFAATIDTAAWLVLLLMFETETDILTDGQFTPPVVVALHGLRLFCYGFIIYALYGYVANLRFVGAAELARGISDLCAVVDEAWSYGITLDQFEPITDANCDSFSVATEFYRYAGMQALVDRGALTEIHRLAWVDVVNAGVWLLVVLNLEIDVRLQEQERLRGSVLLASNACKAILYPVLFLAAVYWGVKGDFVDFWDAFLWLVAFAFIESNVFRWRREHTGQPVV